MPRLSSGRHRKQATVGLAALLGVAGVTATAIALSSPAGNAAEAPKENCGGLDTALQNNLNFIAGQQAAPDAQSAARIANRQAVVDLIQQRRQVAGCTANVVANNGQAAQAPAQQAPAQQAPAQQDQSGVDTGAVGDVVCPGSTVTLSGEGGAPAASSNQFPAGTKLKVTNLDNSKSTTVEVTSVSGSCTLLNNAAFEQVREPGKFLIRRARIERVG
ncbi:septal ring lytic transglycosylase RlpA family protein [Amycolatopsis sp. OK19-0408]|uniref:Septal ring lytic transglycosylase RlpA family protein n=1 Tax=Amycolatopsis iheyensis TaxID=2945988 RepID=A0A9X2NJH0_9PSEU|nr:septal ring lytic transglycosylase RlpA family protein [Amycolatopsis iheyensis]MCR6486000.1 septal ring lytic transglycosylase RlpA family protein [Amycolatopsis iheyensis]